MCYNKVMNIDLSQFTTTELIVMLALGAAVLLFGYRIKKVAFFIIWFIIGLNLTNYLVPWLETAAPEVMTNELWRNLIPIAGGLLMALLGFSIEKLCLGGIVFALTLIITAQYFGTEINTLAIGGVVGIIAAGIAVMLMKPAIIVATALAGAYVVTLSILFWFSGISAETYYFPILAGVTAVGSLFQFATTKHA